MRANRRMVVSVVAAALVIGAGVSAAPASAKTPSITVTPSKALKPGQTVHITGSGFVPKSEVVGVECLRGTSDPADCDGTNYVLLKTDARGAIRTTFTVHRTLYLPTGLGDCSASGCELLVAPARKFDARANAAIAFDPKAPLPQTAVRVKPSTGLLDQQSLTVRGSGFDYTAGGPNDAVVVFQCVVTPFTCATGVGVRPPGTSGRFAASLPAHRVITDPTGNRVDCAQTKHTCEILVFDLFDADYQATAPLAFDASVPPPPAPTLVVKPDSKLPYYARVSVSGKHWQANDLVFFLECSNSVASACAFIDAAGFTDSQGTFAMKPMLQRMLPDLRDPGSSVDCAARHSDCVLIAQDTNGDTVTRSVAFDPSAPIPPPPAATIKPAGPYRNNQVVHINGKHFAPKADFQVNECAFTAHVEACYGVIGGTQRTNAAGDLSTLFQLERKLQAEGPIDCTGKRVQCVLEVSSEGGAAVELPLVFKTGAGSEAAVPAAQLVPVSRRARGGWLAARSAPAVLARSALPGLRRQGTLLP